MSISVLIASHGHPGISKGGAEVSAFRLFTELQRRPGYETWFLGCDGSGSSGKLGTVISQPFSDREYLYNSGEYDWFKFANTDHRFPDEFRALLVRLRPQIVHFHHYLNFGVEAILHVRETLPECKIVLTLHEYLALCHHFGQMVTKRHSSLCHEASPSNCAKCFEEIPRSDFFLRKLFIQRFFGMVDLFISPSEFLAQRYTSWGVAKHRLTVIENVMPRLPPRPGRRSRKKNILRVGFFGQISKFKGIDVLFEAAQILEERGSDAIIFEIYGEYRNQMPEVQSDFQDRLGKAGRNVQFHGPYDEQRVDRLMQSVDLVLMPSIWWENSPVVIQEALRNRTPVVCSNIGGMAEKVRHGLDGFHFPVGNSLALASLLLDLARTPSRLAKLHATMRPPQAATDSVEQHREVYDALLHGGAPWVGTGRARWVASSSSRSN